MPLSAWIILGLIASLFSGSVLNGRWIGPGVGIAELLGLALLLIAYYAVSRRAKML